MTREQFLELREKLNTLRHVDTYTINGCYNCNFLYDETGICQHPKYNGACPDVPSQFYIGMVPPPDWCPLRQKPILVGLTLLEGQ